MINIIEESRLLNEERINMELSAIKFLFTLVKKNIDNGASIEYENDYFKIELDPSIYDREIKMINDGDLIKFISKHDLGSFGNRKDCCKTAEEILYSVFDNNFSITKFSYFADIITVYFKEKK